MIGRRTKTFFWLSVLPLFLVVAAAACATIYSSYLAHSGQDTYFVIFHLHLLPMLAVSASLFLCGLVSLFCDKRSSEDR